MEPFSLVASFARGAMRTGALVTAVMAASACHSASPPVVASTPGAGNSAAITSPKSGGSSRAARTGRDPMVSPPQAAEVTRTAVGVFGDTAALAPAPDNATATGPTWDMDVRSYEGQERVAFYVNFFTQNSRSRFQERLRLGTRYEPMIRAKLRAGGIPEDMSYLALVESGFDPNAYSSAAAVGMWQFMSSTARDVGLRVDWWVDERRDPARSTDAAVRFIHDLQMQFGSLYLAAAAYNGGPGRVSRGLTRFAEDMAGSEGEDRFFALAEHDALRSETKNYVPQIIAAALVGKEPVRYGFAFDSLAQYAYDSVNVFPGTALATVARVSATDLSVIRELNPAVLRGITPPNSSMWIRVPVNCAVTPDQIESALAALDVTDRVGYRSVTTTGSETPTTIASRSGVSAKQLGWYNPALKTTRKGKLLPGQTVLIPTVFAISAARDVPDPNIERYGATTIAAAKSGAVHIVKRGESMGSIAARYNITLAKLKALNGIRGNRVVAGQTIRVKAPLPISTAKVASKTSASSIKLAAKGNATHSKVASAKSASSKKRGTSKVASGKASVTHPSGKKKVAVRKVSPKRTASKNLASK